MINLPCLGKLSIMRTRLNSCLTVCLKTIRSLLIKLLRVILLRLLRSFMKSSSIMKLNFNSRSRISHQYRSLPTTPITAVPLVRTTLATRTHDVVATVETKLGSSSNSSTRRQLNLQDVEAIKESASSVASLAIVLAGACNLRHTEAPTLNNRRLQLHGNLARTWFRPLPILQTSGSSIAELLTT